MVSLIVPCYNGEAYIDRYIDSVLAQNYKNIELILVNDGSMDATHERIEARREEIEASLAKFIYIRQKNQGVGAACSNAFAQSTGEYLALLDADDVLLPDSMKLRVKFLSENPEYALVRSNGYYVREGALNKIVRLFETNDAQKFNENIFEDIMLGNISMWAGCYMIRSSVLQEIYPEKRIYPSRSGQNLQFIMMAAYHRKAGYVDIPLMKYILRDESASHFSGGDAMERELKAMDGYKDIRIHLISNYIQPEERSEWLERIDKLYLKLRMQLALKYRDRELMRRSYKVLRQLERTDISTKVLYFRLINPAVAVCLKFIRRTTFYLCKK